MKLKDMLFMKKYKKIKQKIDCWISQFSNDEKDILIQLLNHFSYYPNDEIVDKVKKLYKKILDNNSEQVDNMVFIPVAKDYGVGYSDELYNQFWIRNGLKDYCEKNYFKLIENGKVFNKVAIVDDYSGTGNTIKTTIEKCIEANPKSVSSEYYICLLHSSEQARLAIENFAVDKKIKIKFIALCYENKAFEKNVVFSENQVNEREKEYKKICTKYEIADDKSMGYESTQALVTFWYNTPNNTLGLFWQDTSKCKAIFPRHKSMSTCLRKMQNKKQNRQYQREKQLIKNHELSEQQLLFLIYLIDKNKDFNYGEACKEFGITEDKIDEYINFLFDEKYIEYKKNSFVHTKKATEVIKTSKIKEINKVKEKKEEFATKDYIPRNFEKIFKGYNK